MNALSFHFSSPISLDDWQLVKVSGDDNQKYLQGQLTADVTKLTEQHALFAAHCDAKGKMWSNLLLFKRGQDIFYIVRKNVAEKQIAELKKYAVFSKVIITAVNNLNMIGITDDLPDDLMSQFSEPDINSLTLADTTYICLPLPTQRIIQISPAPLPDQLRPSSEWQLLDMQADYAIIDAANIASLLPHACNLQRHNAISFDKGCYCGQEMVARAEFRGANKRAMYLLVGEAEKLPTIGDTLEYQIGENWREGGQILAATYDHKDGDHKDYDHKTIYVQAVLNHDLDNQTRFRLKRQEKSHLTIK